MACCSLAIIAAWHGYDWVGMLASQREVRVKEQAAEESAQQARALNQLRQLIHNLSSSGSVGARARAAAVAVATGTASAAPAAADAPSRP